MDNPVYNDDYVKGSDLQQVIDQVNANEIFTDNMTITGNKSEAGMSLSVVDQYGGGGAESSVVESYPFQTTMVFNSDVEKFNVSVNAGQVVLPDRQELLPVYEFNNDKDTDVYIYLVIEGVKNATTGGWSNFTAIVQESLVVQVNTDDINYFLLSFVTDNEINQQRFTTFDSGGRIY